MLTLQPDARATAPVAIPERPDDRSGHAHRQLIGYIGLTLPFVLVLIAGAREAGGPGRWQVLGSISAYYYSGAVAAFVGMLVALALFLFTYRGYGNRYHRADRAAAVTAGIAALGVAFFPTRPHEGVPMPEWWRPLTGWLHYGSAVVLFVMFAVFSLWLFRLHAPGEAMSHDKLVRNRLHLLCGITIVGALAWAGFNGVTGRPIFLPESLALAAFAVSWLVKGYAHVTIASAARSLVRPERGRDRSAATAR